MMRTCVLSFREVNNVMHVTSNYINVINIFFNSPTITGDLLPTTEPMICNPVVNSVSTPINNSMQGVVVSVPHHHTPTLDEEIFAGIDLKSKIEVTHNIGSIE